MGIQQGHSSLLISDYIVYKHGFIFTPFQLIKLVFISHGRTLAAMDNPLIRDRIEAWKYGPVIPVLYHELKIWGDEKVKMLHYCGTVPRQDTNIDDHFEELFSRVISDDERRMIDLTVKHYGGWSFSDLQRMCHEPGSPWDTHHDGEFGTEIPDYTIKKILQERVGWLIDSWEIQ